MLCVQEHFCLMTYVVLQYLCSVNIRILYKTFYYSTHFVISVNKLFVQKHVCLISCCQCAIDC